MGSAATDDRAAYLQSQARGGNIDTGDEGTAAAGGPRPFRALGSGNQTRDPALRVVEGNAARMDSGAAERTEAHVRKDDQNDSLSRYLTATGDPHYMRAFSKVMTDPQLGHNRLTPEENAAIQRVSPVQAERSMAIGTGSAGGFLLPFQLDPTIMLSSNGALNPIRRIARTETITQNEFRLVTSDAFGSPRPFWRSGGFPPPTMWKSP